MYIDYDKNSKIDDGEYLCVVKFQFSHDKDNYCYMILAYCNSKNNKWINSYDFEGKGFYNPEVNYLDGCCHDKYEEVVAYQPIEQYIKIK